MNKKRATMSLALIYTLLFFVMSGCSSAQENETAMPVAETGTGAVTGSQSEEGTRETPKGYEKTLEKWTRSDKKYAGLENKFQITATLLTLEVLNSQLALDNVQYKWSQQDYVQKRNKALIDSETMTKVFVSFFTPDIENNNLDKSSSVWNIFLQFSNGERVQPKSIRRVFGNMSELKQKYPYHNPWSKAYEVIFPVPTSRVSQGGARFNISGPVGSSELKF